MTELPRDASGFRLRGLAMTRVETFTDAAFAFALTLLVVSLEPPTDIAALRQALLGVPAFLLSAAMLMLFWWGHHEWSRRYGLDDGRSMVLSCVLVFTVLVYVYPLRFMFGTMIEWMRMVVGGAVTNDLGIRGPADVSTLFAIYGVGFAAMSTAVMLLNLHAWSRREQLGLDAVERHLTIGVIGAYGILTAAGIISVAVALATPTTMVGLPGWVYAPLGLMPLYGRWVARRAPLHHRVDALTAPAAAPILTPSDSRRR